LHSQNEMATAVVGPDYIQLPSAEQNHQIIHMF
jgi:hypothetical protein